MNLSRGLTRNICLMLMSCFSQVRAADIGHLVKIKGIVTRVSDVKPMLTV